MEQWSAISRKNGDVVGALSCAAALGIVLIPLWVFSPGYTLLVIGGFAMQFMVQGAWGIVPVHLNELSPDAVRGTFPGFAYQLGNLFAANTAVVEAQLANHFHDASGHPDYAKALGLFTLVIFRSANFPRRYRSRKTRKGILVFAAELYREPAGARLVPLLAGSACGRNWAAI